MGLLCLNLLCDPINEISSFNLYSVDHSIALPVIDRGGGILASKGLQGWKKLDKWGWAPSDEVGQI